MPNNRVKFYSTNDWSSGGYLRQAEEVLKNLDAYSSDLSINKLIELYNIKQYFDNGMALEEWTPDYTTQLIALSRKIPGILGTFFGTVSDENLEVLYKETDLNYLDDFWTLLCVYKVYMRISAETINSIITSDNHAIWRIMRHKLLVTSFGTIIATHLVHNSHTAEKLISHYLEAHRHADYQLYFPSEFSQDMRDQVLLNYVERDDGNINILRLLEGAQSTKEFPVSDRLRLKARKRAELLQEKLFSHSAGITFGAQVSFASIPDGSIKVSYEDHIPCYSYSREWIEENQDYQTLLNNFIYLFESQIAITSWTPRGKNLGHGWSRRIYP